MRRLLIPPILFLTLCGCGNLDVKKSSSSQSLISGRASAGPIKSATVTAYDLNDDGSRGHVVAESTTDSEGLYSLAVPSASGPLEIAVSGGFYSEEANGVTVSLGASELRARIPDAQNGQDASITPLTEIEG